MTDNADIGDRTWVFYDGECPMCLRWVGRFRFRLEKLGFAFVPLQSSAARVALNVPDKDLMAEMRVLTPEKRIIGGADALVYLATKLTGGKIIWALATLPGVRPLLRVIYRRLAPYRLCIGGSCRVPANKTSGFGRVTGWLPLALMVPAALVVAKGLTPWAYMWAIAFAFFFGCKWLSFVAARTAGMKPGPARIAGYLLAWPGMDARTFLRGEHPVAKPLISDWVPPVVKAFLGAGILWAAVNHILPLHSLAAGWAGMVGIILALHFGLFHLLSLAWRTAGVSALPLMRAPMLSRSVSEFWSRRWNTAFHQLAHEFVFRRIRPLLGCRLAILTAFAVSGLIHELVITVPAHGGYGLPTAYFVAQGVAVLFERSRVGRALGVGKGGRGWLFTLMVTAGPAFWLFPPPFVLNVIVPILKTIGAN